MNISHELTATATAYSLFFTTCDVVLTLNPPVSGDDLYARAAARRRPPSHLHLVLDDITLNVTVDMHGWHTVGGACSYETFEALMDAECAPFRAEFARRLAARLSD